MVDLFTSITSVRTGKRSYLRKSARPVILVLILFGVLCSSVSLTALPAAAASEAYVANWGDNTVSVINTKTNTVVATIPVGSRPSGLAITPNGKFAYVANQYSNTVSVINTETNTVVATIPVGSFPLGVAITPDGDFAYVANSIDYTVSVIDTKKNTVVGTITGGLSFPASVAITPDGDFTYVANEYGYTVSVIDTEKHCRGYDPGGVVSAWRGHFPKQAGALWIGLRGPEPCEAKRPRMTAARVRPTSPAQFSEAGPGDLKRSAYCGSRKCHRRRRA